jgi:hypothetical protein
LVGVPEGRRPLGRPRHNGRIILRWTSGSGMCWYGLDWVGSG